MNKFINRWTLIFATCIVVIALFVLTDATVGVVKLQGAPVILLILLSLSSCFLAVGLAHIIRKGLLDYIDLAKFADKAMESSTGAGLVFLGVCQLLNGLFQLLGSQLPK